MNNFLRTIAEKDLYQMGITMGVSEMVMDRFMRNRFRTLSIFIAVGIPLFLFNKIISLVAIVAGVYMYRQQYTMYKKRYNNFMFRREFEFNGFLKMLIPYLKQDDGEPLNLIFEKCHARLNEGVVKDNLERLMFEMVDKPQDVNPFRDFAKDSSGSDDSDLIMLTIYDFQQNVGDSSVIEELGEIISERMMKSIDAIIKVKISRFNLFPTTLTMYPLLIIFGYVIGIAILEISKFIGPGGIGI